ncbi:hypothetical protein ASG49_11390 [Marmoricola sp. Leaf446]|uniref:hypothetical protein n=1 Tax=Marmoricola sp. Leaf446 TaxID=1736379 RepID=UPI0006F6CDF4|nr:hypothetical protein [Marmoricola sp. Leaf446]KQT91602.1 hypothetical protein ASG49_11390 [Marmoricola sp. Leaf446]
MTTVPQSPVPVRYGLASRDRERHWTVIVDAVLLGAVVGWFVLLAVGGLHATVTVVAGVVLTAMVVHRVLILLERQRSARASRGGV